MGVTPAAVTVTGRCQGCGACLLTCPVHAIRPAPAADGDTARPLVVLGSLCTGCGECVEVCPVDAIDEVQAQAHGEPMFEYADRSGE